MIDQHPHEAWQQHTFGCAHISQHRVLPQHVAALRRILADLLAPIPREEQVKRLHTMDEGFRHDMQVKHQPFDPVADVVHGARAYNRIRGLSDPHAMPYHQVRTSADTIDRVGSAYGRLPDFDKSALPHFKAMGEEVGRQFDHLTGPRGKGGMGVHVESVDYDPYPTVHHMVKDLRDNGRMRVLGTHVTGGHPYFSNHQNDMFRAVHDAFGHAATGRGFDASGEEAAYLAHSRMFSHHALPAMTTETRMQNGFVHLNNDFGPQKIALPPPHIMRLPVHGAGGAVESKPWQDHPDLSRSASGSSLTSEVMTNAGRGGGQRAEISMANLSGGVIKEVSAAIGKRQRLHGSWPTGAQLHQDTKSITSDVTTRPAAIQDICDPNCLTSTIGGGLGSELTASAIMHTASLASGWSTPVMDTDTEIVFNVAERTPQQQVLARRQHATPPVTGKATDWNEYRRIQDAQDRRYERPGTVGGQEEHDEFYGRGEHAGAGQEHRLTPQEWMRHSHEPTFEELPPQEHEWHRGYDLGAAHSTGIDEGAFDHAYSTSTHPDHFFSGYTEGLRSVATANPLSTPQDAVAFEEGRQNVRDLNGTPLCDWHTDRAKELMGLSDQIGRQTGLVDETQPHTHTETPAYPGRCAACASGQAKNEGRPWDAPQGGGFRPSPMSEHQVPGRSWPNKPKRTGPFMPLPQSMSYRIAVRRGQKPLDSTTTGLQRIAHKISADMPDVVVLRKIAHDSGDGQTILHCPFCGSGQVIATSDGGVECEFCFSGDTRYLTVDGVKTLAETVGTKQWVMSAPSQHHRDGRWVQAEIRSFGRQPLMEVVLRRNRQRKVVLATAEHRWFVLCGAKKRDQHRVETTSSLLPNHRLATLRLPRFSGDVPSEAVRMGFVFGDGTIQVKNGTNYGMVSVWGSKVEAVGKYFDEIACGYPIQTENGIVGLRYHAGMVGYHKHLPPIHSDREYLLGWLMGYFAADGCVTKDGQVSLTSRVQEHLEHMRDVCSVLGIGTYSLRSVTGVHGYTQGESTTHYLGLVNSDLDESFFLKSEHRKKYEETGQKKTDRFFWTVESVSPTDRMEEVYCAVVPDTHSFVLEDNVWVGNCHASFTVQVQPQYPAFPQSIDGAPVNVPGMGPDFSQYGGTPPGEEAPMPMEGEEGDGDESGNNPFAEGEDETEPPEEDSDEDEDSGGGGNPFAKKSYLSTTGSVLNHDAYLRHLALACSPDRAATLARIRAVNGTR